jgi:hypothetical protein
MYRQRGFTRSTRAWFQSLFLKPTDPPPFMTKPATLPKIYALTPAPWVENPWQREKPNPAGLTTQKIAGGSFGFIFQSRGFNKTHP